MPAAARSAEPAADQFTIGVGRGGRGRAISEKAAAGLFVKPV